MQTKEKNAVESVIVVEQIFNAPIGIVWKALTSKEDIKQWSFDIKDFKPQAGFEFQFYGEKNGVKYDHRCKITEVIVDRKLAFTWRYEGYEGNSLVTFNLLNEGNKTRLRLIHEGLETFPKIPDFEKENFMTSWSGIIGKNLKQFVEKCTFTISRVFDAPRDLVWKACSDAEHMKHWWGPKGSMKLVSKMDFSVGGTYLCCMQSPDGKEMWGKFVFLEINRPKRIVFVNSFSDENGGLTRHPKGPNWPLEILSTFTFTEHEGKTIFTVQWSPLSPTDEELKTFKETRASMDRGWSGTLDQLAAYLPNIH